MKNLIFLLLLVGTLTFSCSDNDDFKIGIQDEVSETNSDTDDNKINLEDDASETCANTKVFDSNFTGTACCSQRNSELSIGKTIEYEYFTNLADPNVNWQVKSGDIEIVSGSNSSIVTIRLGDSFTEGEIYVLGKSGRDERLVCGHPIIITKK